MANQITLTFSNVTNNGLPCKDPVITIIGTNNEQILFPCGDKVDKNGQIKISVPEELFSGSCINGFIKCSECGHCEEKEFEACLCNTSADCKECEKCEGGVCISLCPDKLCQNNTCVDCKGPEDCPPGFICVGGECVCNGKINQLGQCVDCFTSADCSSCEECVNGGCVPLTCPNNLICINNGCGCPPGFVYEATTNSCVPDDECDEDSDCKECETCVSGQCQPIVCPEGYTCVGGNCVYAPCNDKPCNNGLDCGNEDCGCPDDKKVCTSCLEDPNGRGCEPNGCKNTPCSNNECQEGCGCYQGECVPCSWLTPQEQANTPGCDGGGGGCTDDFDSKVKGCNLETTLITNEPCACPVISGALTNSQNSPTTYYQNPGSNQSTTTQTKDGYISYILAKSSYKYQLRKGISDSYSGFLSLPKLDDVSNPDIAHNEMPNSGTFTLEIYGTYKTETAIGVFGAPTTVLLSTSAGSIINKTEVDFNNISFKTVEIATAPVAGSGKRGLYKFLTNIKFVVKYSNLIFPNICDYGSMTVFEKSYTASTNLVDENTLVQIFNTAISVDKIQTEGDRLPLFVYKRSKTSNFTNNDVFRKVYVPKINNVYKDILYGPGCVTDKGKYPLVSPEFGFYSGYNYLITNNCGCEGAKQKLVTNAIACEDVNPVVTVSLCNKKLEVSPINTKCAVNQDLSTTLVNCPYPADAQVYFNLYVNNVLEQSLVPNKTSFSKVFDESITSIKITHSHNESCVVFEQEYPSAEKEPVYNFDCKEGKFADIIINQVVDPGVTITKVTNLGNFNTYTPVNGVIKVVNVLKGSTVTLQFDFSDGCSQKMDIIINCCGEMILTSTTNNNGKICNSVPVTVTLSTTNAVGALKYYMNDVLIPTNQANKAIFVATTPGVYVAKVVDSTGCERTINVTIGACTDITLTLTPDTICVGQNSTLLIQGDPNSTVILKYPNGTTTTVTLDSSGKWQQSVSTDGIYEIVSYNSVAITGLTAELEVITNPTLTSIIGPSSICEDTPAQFTFTGTPNANITINFGFGTPVNLVIGSGGTVTHELVYQNPGSYTIAVPSINVNGNCEASPTTTKAVTVLQKPIITVGQTNCNLLANTSSTAVVVTPNTATLAITSGSGSITGSSGNFFVNSDTSETLTLKASNGACETTQSLVINCNCPEIFNSNVENGIICASYNHGTSSYLYSLVIEPSAEFNYASGFTCTLTYKGVDYPIPSIGTQGTFINTLPPTYELSDPNLVIKAVDNSTGCQDTIVIVPVINVTPIVTITPPGQGQFCTNVPYIFNASISGNSAGYNFNWTVLEDGNYLSVPNNTGQSLQFTPTSNGAYYDIFVTLTKEFAGTQNECGTNSNIIQVEATTCCNITLQNIYVPVNQQCKDLQFYASGGGTTYNWTWGPDPATPNNELVSSGTATTTGNMSMIIDTDVEYVGATGKYLITVTSGGCSKSMVFQYTRCSCMCNNVSNVCGGVTELFPVSSVLPSGNTHSLGMLAGEYNTGTGTFSPRSYLLYFGTNIGGANSIILRKTIGSNPIQNIMVTPLIGNAYPSGCAGTELFVDLIPITTGHPTELSTEILNQGGVILSEVTSVVKTSNQWFTVTFTVTDPGLYEIVINNPNPTYGIPPCEGTGYTYQIGKFECLA